MSGPVAKALPGAPMSHGGVPAFKFLPCSQFQLSAYTPWRQEVMAAGVGLASFTGTWMSSQSPVLALAAVLESKPESESPLSLLRFLKINGTNTFKNNKHFDKSKKDKQVTKK